MSVSVKHDTLGTIKGNVVDETAQFLGLKYASLTNRFAPPELIQSYGPHPTDATKYGYATRVQPCVEC